MRIIFGIVRILLLILVFAAAGCEPHVRTNGGGNPAVGDNGSGVYDGYNPVKVEIMPLSEIAAGEEGAKIKVYVNLLDSFGCQIKRPGVFRFELYERVLRNAEPKGKRVAIWPDIELKEAAENHNYWRDFLRAYEFNLDFEQGANHDYILEVTYLCLTGKRLSAEFVLKQGK